MLDGAIVSLWDFLNVSVSLGNAEGVCRKSSCAGAWQHFSREPDLQAWTQDPDLMHTCELEQVLGVRFVHLHQQMLYRRLSREGQWCSSS